ncbi:ABC1 family protein [Klebsormidium nitens]|uniref:ABC1 family protein n=1 Tax=Klebsormidium nitens TaxID=105231 RepID=A0A1Y1IHM1_KLENI|nr:ABC1 family protein [Klebsormidium nitens]|eukprot:GAQ90183.1 ABC1 family protein [Klebsormidium nitens]
MASATKLATSFQTVPNGWAEPRSASCYPSDVYVAGLPAARAPCCPSVARRHSSLAASTSGRGPALASDFVSWKAEGPGQWAPPLGGLGTGDRKRRSGVHAAFDLPSSPRRGNGGTAAGEAEKMRRRSGPAPLRAMRQIRDPVPSPVERQARSPPAGAGRVQLEQVANGRATTRTPAAVATRFPLPGIGGSPRVVAMEVQSTPELQQLEMESGLCVAFKKYTPESVRSRALESPGSVFAIAARCAEIVFSLGTYWASLSWDCLLGKSEQQVPYRAQQLRRLLCTLGPSFIKAGQVLANRPDIVREDYMNELCILQDNVPAFPDKEAFDMIEREIGRPLEQVFSSISSSPVAAASLGQVYKATLAATGEEVAIKVQRPGIEPIIYRDLFLFRLLASTVNGISLKKLGCNAQLIVDEFGEKLLEELDYTLEARNIEDFYANFQDDPTVKIPAVYRAFSGKEVLVMEWIDGIRCTDPQGIQAAGIDVESFITVGVSAALRQLLEFGLFHGDPHPGNIFAMRDGRIAYVDFGNVAELSQYNKQILIDAIVHAVNEDYVEMAGDFCRLGFLAPGTDITPIVPALEAIWQNSTGKGLADFNFRTVTGKFNELVYQYPIRIPERFSLVIRSLLTQEGICLTLQPDFKFLEVAYPYVAKRLLTDPDPALRERLIQVLFRDGVFQWKRLENLILLAKEGAQMTAKVGTATPEPQPTTSTGRAIAAKRKGLDLSDTVKDGARLVFVDPGLRRQLLMAFTEDSRLHVREVADLYRLVQAELQPRDMVQSLVQDIPTITRDLILSWSDSILSER